MYLGNSNIGSFTLTSVLVITSSYFVMRKVRGCLLETKFERLSILS